jgi:UDP-N-acetylmuramoyl-L-alanyl-D-glutamate--2,6-diaminopimelate ligase
MHDPAADWFGHRQGRALDVSRSGEPAVRLEVALPGAFNAANALLAWAMLRSSDIPPAIAARGIEQARVPGRMEEVPLTGGVRGIVDYAHTPEAIERALAAIRESMSDRAQLITVLGAGGDRDPSKRAVMGAAAASLADRVIVTDDNPRSERPADIRAALMEGARSVSSVVVEEVPDRRTAIQRAVDVAEQDDVIVLLGKGHETGIETDGQIKPFDDRDELTTALRKARP